MNVIGMAILETIAAANAAYAVIKKFAENGRETANLAKSVGQFLQAEDDLREQVSKKKSSTWAKALGKDANDFEEFYLKPFPPLSMAPPTQPYVHSHSALVNSV